MKHWLFLAPALLLAACGGSPAPSSAPAAPSSAPAQKPASSASAAAPASAGGALSGELTFYSAAPAELAPELARQFGQKSGVKVNVFQGDTGAILAKLEAEKARPQADVLALADWSAGLQMSKDGALLPYMPPDAAKVPAAYQDPAKAFVAQGMSGLTIVYNTDKVSTAPQDWDDMLAPAWKDKLTMPDPSGSGSAYDYVAGFLKRRGEDAGWKYFTGLKANGMIVPGSNAKAQEPVTSGSRLAMIGAVDHTAYDSIARGEKLAIVYPKDGTVLSPRPLVILKSTKNPAAAKAFVDYTLSEEGQKFVANYWVTPARSDVPERQGHARLSDINVWPADWEWEAQHRSDVLARFTSQIVK